jgi:hypothetical protein
MHARCKPLHIRKKPSYVLRKSIEFEAINIPCAITFKLQKISSKEKYKPK